MNPALKAKLWSLAKGALLSGIGAVAAYLASQLSGAEWSPWGLLAAMAISNLANAAKKFLIDKEEPATPADPAPPDDNFPRLAAG